MTMVVEKDIGGLIYIRDDDRASLAPFWKFRQRLWQDGKYVTQTDEGKPHIICDCGSSKFMLRYGNYELFAKCADCGAEDLIYDG